MKHKRLFTLILALCLILSMVPAGAMAAEAKPSAEIVPGGELMGQVNPMAENLPAAAVRKESAELNEVIAKKFYSTAEPAADAVRAAMVARQPSVVIGITKQAYSTNLLYEIMDKTLAHTGVANEGDYLTCHGIAWEAYPYESSSGISVEFKFTYITSADNETQVDAAVDALLAELNLWNASDYDKIKGVYDWICTNVAYDYELQGGLLAYSAYGALVNRSAVCQGYASLFYRLMLELGVDCRVITGEVDGGAHAWNIVKLNGVYYNVDATFDAIYRQADLNYSYFLVSDLNFLDHVSDFAYTTPDFLAAYPKAEFNYDDSNDFALYGYCGAEGEYGENLMWVLQDGVLVIFGEGAMAAHYGINSSWDSYDEYVVGVYVDEGVTTISSGAFSQMTNLTEVYIPSTVEIIEGSAFFNCSNLHTINLPDGLTTIGEYAFQLCSSLTEITIPDSVTSIGSMAFANCTSLTEITIPAGVTVLSTGCFYECQNLSSVTLPEGLLTLGDSCMIHCFGLTSLTLPESLERIGGIAFRGSGLKRIIIPKNVKHMGHMAFLETAIETIGFTGDAPEFDSQAFHNIVATVYYPAGNETWTEEVMQNYGGVITWKAACEVHEYESAVTTVPSCTESGKAIHTCTTCGLSYEETLPAAHTYSSNEDTICDVCTRVRHVEAEYPDNPPVVHMFRLYDPNSGEHFYTGSTEERDHLVSVGWNYEGVGFSFPVVGAPVYRLFDPVYGEHMYTMDIDEVNYLIGEGWNNEGIAFNTAPATEVPQYRLHNPNETRGAYHFTSSAEERDNLLAVGWEYQGIGWYSCWK